MWKHREVYLQICFYKQPVTKVEVGGNDPPSRLEANNYSFSHA